ncbi:MAG: hypothetical protein OHK0047_23980 [Leptolyngbyaceae cyanobacterium]
MALKYLMGENLDWRFTPFWSNQSSCAGHSKPNPAREPGFSDQRNYGSGSGQGLD